MSHFSRVTTKLTNRECLIQALQDLNLTVQLYEQPYPLRGYYGSSQGQSAEIIVPGDSLRLRADIGFKLNASEGIYEAIHDPYETVRCLGENFFTNTLMQAYGKRMVQAKALELRSKFGECNITEETNGNVHTLRLTFAAHQQQQQYVRR
ncbi:MAG: DUF1257 domain-containing protein [Stigonema ocellatum SAG 48.90 = DSM 106950]|nr:DUF1257 domain-containing protein [Stigonema ocellatum SAG 48.90 = DSM 106950]